MANTQLLAEMVEQISHLLPRKSPRSLCELELEETDYQALRKFIRDRLTRSDVRLAGWKAAAVIFDFAVEVARRKAVGHRLWAIVADEFPGRLRGYLFPNNHPSLELKQWIETAARMLKLRHVFDNYEPQSWYITTHLQFGFTQPGFQANLPEWLCGQNVPDAVQRLLSGHLRSASFRELWGALQAYRRDWIAEGALRRIIQNCPWVLPEWEDDLVRLSRDKLGLADVAEDDDATGRQPSPIVQAPRLKWNGAAPPEFVCEFADLNALELQEPHYHLMAQDTRLATIFRQPDGTYRADESEVRFPADRPEVHLNLIDQEGELHSTHQLVTLWEGAAELSAFDERSGRCVDVSKGRMRPANNYLLILQPGLELLPASDEWVLLGKPTRCRVELLAAGWDADSTYVADGDGECVWKPPIDEGPAPEPPALEPVRIECDNRQRSIRLGESIRPVVRGMPSDATLVYVRLAGKPIVFDARSGQEPTVTVTPDVARAGLTFTLGVRFPADTNGRSIIRLKRQVNAEITGVAQLDAEGWTQLDATEVITARACRERPMCAFLPKALGGQKVVVMEGPQPVRWIGRRSLRLGQPHGTGAPLVIRQQPFNCPSDLLTIAKGVYDTGVCESAIDDQAHENGVFPIRLVQECALSDEHRVVLWPCGTPDEPTVFGREAIATDNGGRCWSITCSPEQFGRATVAAVTFRGHWLGCSVLGDPADLLAWCNDAPDHAHRVASLVRWFRLPILLRDSPRSAPVFSEFARNYPAAVLSAWLKGDSLPCGLVHDNSFERRQIEMAQIREIFLGWTPNQEQATAIVHSMADSNEDPLGDVVLKVLSDLPLLTGQIMRLWLRTHGTPQGYPLSFYMNVIRCHFTNAVGKRGASITTDELLLRAAETMRAGLRAPADEFFVRQAIGDRAIATLAGGTLTREETSNLSNALQVASFREYLAMRVLEELEKGDAPS